MCSMFMIVFFTIYFFLFNHVISVVNDIAQTFCVTSNCVLGKVSHGLLQSHLGVQGQNLTTPGS